MPLNRIYKMQLTPDKNSVIICDRQKDYEVTTPYDKEIQAYMGTRHKVYVKGYINEAGRLVVVGPSKKKSW